MPPQARLGGRKSEGVLGKQQVSKPEWLELRILVEKWMIRLRKNKKLAKLAVFIILIFPLGSFV